MFSSRPSRTGLAASRTPRRDAGTLWLARLARVLVALGLLLSAARTAHAQETGGIAGTIMDGWDGRPLGGVNVLLRGTTKATQTDGQGRYQLTDVPPGSHTVRFSLSGYAAVTVTDIRVIAGQTTAAPGTLRPEFYELEEFEVTADEFEEGAVALLLERQNAAGILDSIGADQFRRLGASDAAEIVTKITGATVVDGKFAVIRGLTDRYNVSLLNGAEVPTADPFRKAAQLDLIPSQMIETVLVSKTFTPDLPGNFGGGTINIITRSVPEKFFAQFGGKIGFNTQAHFRDNFITSEGGGLEWFGMDDGFREIPAGLARYAPNEVPTPPLRLEPGTQERADAVVAVGKSFNNNDFGPINKTALPNHELGFVVGDRRSLGDQVFGYVLGFGYKHDYNFFDDGRQVRYEPEVGGNALAVTKDLNETRGVDEVSWAGTVGLGYAPVEAHQFDFTFVYTQNGENNVRDLVGTTDDQEPGEVFRSTAITYSERNLQMYQLRGEHEFPGRLDYTAAWNASLGLTSQDDPDQRFFAGQRDSQGRWGISSAPVPPVPSRYFRTIEEENGSAKLDNSIGFDLLTSQPTVLRFGGSFTGTERNYRERAVQYRSLNWDGSGDEFRTTGDLNQLVTDELLEYRLVRQGRFTNYVFPRYVASVPANYVYSGTQDVPAGYVTAEVPVLERVKVSGGFRYESTSLNTITTGGELPVPQTTIQEYSDVLPAAWVTYTIITNMNLRLAYSQTITRPAFREITPIPLVNFAGGELLIGNPDLGPSSLKNYDLRWEWYFRPGALIAVGGFYKDIKDAIELVRLSRDSDVTTYDNRDAAEVYGAELEVRSGLDVIHEALADFSFGGSFALIKSETELSDQELEFLLTGFPDAERTRPLFDQSPYIITCDLSWDSEPLGTSVTLAFSMFGSRLIVVNPDMPSVYEEPAPVLDLNISQQLSEHWRLRFQAKNLLDPTFESVIKMSDFGQPDAPYSVSTKGRTFSLAFVYDF